MVGAVTGAGEAMSLILRLVFGPLADRTGRYWSLTIIGYGLTAVCVPLLAVVAASRRRGTRLRRDDDPPRAPRQGIRSPSKSALLAHVAGAVGRGRGFGVHKALDQVGPSAGRCSWLPWWLPLHSGGAWPPRVRALSTMLLLFTLRRRVPDPSVRRPPP